VTDGSAKQDTRNVKTIYANVERLLSDRTTLAGGAERKTGVPVCTSIRHCHVNSTIGSTIS